MTTIDEREYTSTFAGLKSTAITAGVVLVAGFCGHEILMRLRRYPEEDAKRARGEKVRDRGAEGYAMGYLFRARSYVASNPTPEFGSYPFSWIWTTSFKLPEKFYETHCGPDATVYLRFLRGSFYWTCLSACTVFPTLLSINFIESSADVATTSLERASLSSLTRSENGTRLLWVHVLCIWFLTTTWICTLVWVGYGAIRIRRNVLRALLRDEIERHQEEKVLPPREPRPVDPQDERDVGWRFRTVLMRNIPPAMRSEEALREYFEGHLLGKTPVNPHSSLNGHSSHTSITMLPSPDDSKASFPPPPREKSLYNDAERPLLSDIIIVRRSQELNELYNKYRDVEYALESAHCALAENVMRFVKAKVEEEERVKAGEPPKRRPLASLGRLFRRKEEIVSEDVERLAREGDSRLVETLRGFLPGGSPPLDSSGQPLSLWSVLHDLHATPILLDRFQPLFKLRHFRGQSIPSIDYHLAKLNLLATLIEDKRSHPELFEAAPSAFITFERASDARRARKELKWRPGGKVFAGKILECKTKLAPEVRDLDWNRLVYVSLSADILRGALLQVLIWAATIFWVIPLSFLVGLLSLNSIAKYIPKLATFLESNSATQTLFSSLLPTGIVALLGMLVPTLIGIITRNGQALITVSKLHALVQSRYWVWLMVNIILVFTIGLSAFTAFLEAFKSPGSVLTVIASAFPKGATFFVSWTLLVVGLHHGIEICLLGIPYINHATIRMLKAPRKREIEALPRSFNYAYWAPNHLLVLAVTAIFAILNPLVIAFNAFYQAFVIIVFKNQLAHTYYRRWYENNGRFIYRRCFRYSLDAFIVGQVVAIALLWVLKYFKLGGACIPLIPITAFVKLIGTRWFDKLMNEIDELEIDLVCGEGDVSPDLSVPLTEQDVDVRLKPSELASTMKSFVTTTLPSLTFRPDAPLPAMPSPHKNVSHIRPRSESRLTANKPQVRSRSNSARPKVARSSLDDDRPMLAPIVSNTSGVSSHELHDMGRPSPKSSPILQQQPSITGRLDLFAFSKGEITSAEPSKQSSLVTSHPPVVRDDRPVTNVRYDNPAQVASLARSLWLPRDPLLPCDLGDTVDYWGRALVSSEGDRGIIGTWDEHLTDAEDEALERPGRETSDELLMPKPSLKRVGSHLSLKNAEKGGLRRKGTERIRVAGDVAAKIEAEEGVKAVATRRRGSSGGSTMLPDRSPSMRRRGTGDSTHDGSTPGSPPSPTLHRHPLAPHKSSPRIPTFTEEPETLSLPPSSHPNAASTSTSAGYPFPPPQPPSPHSTLRRRPSHVEEPPTSPGASSLSLSFTSPRSPTMNRRGRSTSVANSLGPAIAEDAEGEVSISQAEALRNELLEEERQEHEKRIAREEARKKNEERDKTGGWLARMLLSNEDDNDVQGRT